MPDSRQLRRTVRQAIPEPLRRRLYDWSPSRRRRWRRVPGLQTVAVGSAIALTFDDGPDPAGTPATLAELATAGAKATFFVLGRHAEEYPDLIAQTICGGHEIALHGMDHRRHDRLSAADAERELVAGIAAIEQAGAGRPAWYRPPFGASSPTIAAVCDKLGLRLAYWSAWGQDWEDNSASRIAGLVERDLAPGAVVLLHDSALYGQRATAAATAGSIPLIVAAARAKGFEPDSLSGAMGEND